MCDWGEGTGCFTFLWFVVCVLSSFFLFLSLCVIGRICSAIVFSVLFISSHPIISGTSTEVHWRPSCCPLDLKTCLIFFLPFQFGTDSTMSSLF